MARRQRARRPRRRGCDGSARIPLPGCRGPPPAGRPPPPGRTRAAGAAGVSSPRPTRPRPRPTPRRPPPASPSAASPSAASPSAAPSSAACTRGGCPAATIDSGSTSVITSAGRAMSDTRTADPITRSLMSTSRWAGMSAGRDLMVSENICCSSTPSARCSSSASPVRVMVTSAVTSRLGSTTWKSTWVTLPRTGWRCSSRAMVRNFLPSTCSDSTALRPASVLSAARSSRADHRHGDGVDPGAVDHGRDPAVVAQPARRAGAGGTAGLGHQDEFGHG